jgi:hypothetical protein
MEFTIHPELPASDIQRARAWYKEKLGLDPVTVGGDPSIPTPNRPIMSSSMTRVPPRSRSMNHPTRGRILRPRRGS